jgi:hypothetical protein
MATLGVLGPPDVSRSHQARHEFHEGPPGKAGFRISGDLLLGGGPPLFDQLQECLAAVAQPLAFLDLVEHRYRLLRQLEKHLLPAGRGKTATVGLNLLCDSAARSRHHQRQALCFTRKAKCPTELSLCPLIPASESGLVFEKLGFSSKIFCWGFYWHSGCSTFANATRRPEGQGRIRMRRGWEAGSMHER